ncbi:Ame1p KNAG_0M00870 [Huiozyma naganishii CBS 8797]|uniref:Inner kinetochore subunit AME1 domain-containing protein n=1 Tax=Huiozyma naganishii (strain ATCC MYA-139 / BCRC 22969 / CBS 8797 / KCTC 17520 / NBRC 10181 / NCYC 3082 / Yp74L-3) TaxID=1071383 RepID=J7RDI6_HUIN7|nr:hypothetical protein KNAG_0M00870 [Kazachstania naganishii CBS 8797]CCK72940.1 hypothetical protein KNAG_0M00870 [Kazachstania naganishii CBS 8797]
MDRHTKRLYRQRGSNLRRLVDMDSVVVIRTPRRQSPPAMQFDTPEQDEAALDLGGKLDLGEEGELSLVADAPPPVPTRRFEFAKVDARDMPVSRVSAVSISVVERLLEQFVQQHLVAKAKADFHTGGQPQAQAPGATRTRKMMYKLDYKTFQKIWFHGIERDINDLRDIGLANNELFYQWQTLQRRRRKLSAQLVALRGEVDAAEQSHEWFDRSEENSRLQRTLQLNESLHKLDAALTTTKPKATQHQTPPHEPGVKVQELCRLLDPYNGLLAKVQRANNNNHIDREP